MINVNMNSNLQGVQGWDQLAGMVKTSETKAAGGADVRIENKQIVVTVSDGKATQSVSVSVPDLGTMDSAPDTAALQSVAAKIVALADTLVAAGAFNADGTAGTDLQAAISRLQNSVATLVGASATDPSAGSVNTSKALFDLYALMALMVEIAQKQRDTSREIRLVENQQVQNSIKQQADEMRSAAEIALGFGIATAVFSGVMSVVTMAKQAKAFSQQSSATKTMETPTQNLKTAELATTPEAAKAHYNAVQSKTPEAVRAKVDTPEFTQDKQNFIDRIGPANEQVRAAETKQAEAGKALSDLKANPEAKPEEIEAKAAEYEKASGEVMKLTADRATIERGFFNKLDARVKASDAAISVKEAEIAAKQTELKSAHGAAAADIKGSISQLKNELTALKQENAYLRATSADLKAQYASEGVKNADLARAQNKYDYAKQQMQLSDQFAGSQQMMNRWMGIQQLSMTLTQMSSSVGNMIAEMQRADATMQGVEQTQHNEQLDQIKDLFQQAETVVQAIVQLMQAVLSAENESLMEAIRA